MGAGGAGVCPPKKSQTTTIPVIAVTGEVASNRSGELRALGALETLVKPYRVQELTALVDRALER